MPGPRAARTALNAGRCAARVVAVATLVSRAGAAQLAPRPDWYVTASLGLVGREIRTWKPVHLALSPAGWDGRFPTCPYSCPNASEIVEGRPPAPTLAVRRRLHRNWQLRVFAGAASPGYYPGQGVNTAATLSVRPNTVTIGAQGAFGHKSLWFAAGPTGYAGRLSTAAGSSAATARRTGLGFALAAGFMLPRTSRLYVDMMVERRFAGSLTTPVLTVPGEPDVPTLTVPLSATVLSVSLGWRR